MNAIGEYLIKMCQERGMILGNTWCKERRKNKYVCERLNPRDEALVDYVLIEGAESMSKRCKRAKRRDR